MFIKGIKKSIISIFCAITICLTAITGSIIKFNVYAATELSSITINGVNYYQSFIPGVGVYLQDGNNNDWQYVFNGMAQYISGTTYSTSAFQNMGNSYQSIYGSYPFGNETNQLTTLDVSITPHALGYFTYLLYGNGVTLKPGTLNNNQIIKNIKYNKPIILYFNGTNTSDKCVLLCTGYISQNTLSTGLKKLIIHDPYNGSVNFLDITGNNVYYTRPNGKQYVWTNSIILADNEPNINTSITALPMGIGTQSTNSDCWAECVRSIVNYKLGTSYSTTQIKNTASAHGWINIDGTMSTSNTINLLNVYFGNNPNYNIHQTSYPLSYSQIQNYINNDKPILLIGRRLANPDTTGNGRYAYHDVVISGYGICTYDPSGYHSIGDSTGLHLLNPQNGSAGFYYDADTNDLDFTFITANGGIYDWYQTIVLN